MRKTTDFPKIEQKIREKLLKIDLRRDVHHENCHGANRKSCKCFEKDVVFETPFEFHRNFNENAECLNVFPQKIYRIRTRNLKN